MKLELEFGTALCYTPVFIINNIKANSEDFNEQYDRDPYNAEDYACGNMQFTRISPTTEVLAKYNISNAEYALIADQLENGLSFGSYGWCV